MGSEPEKAVRPLRILVAEDHALNQLLVRAILEPRGHAVVIAEDGRRVLAELDAQPFDLILMDLQMPLMDGLETTAAIRAREVATGAHVPILAMTAQADENEQLRCRAAGMDGFITKPFAYRDLIERVEGKPSALPAAAAAPDPPMPREELDRLFAEEAVRLGAEIGHALARRSPDTLASLSHQLRGIAGHFRSLRIAEVAKRLEALGRAGDLGAATEEVFAQLLGELRRLEARGAAGAGP